MKIKSIPHYVERYCQRVLKKSFRQAVTDNFEEYKSKIYASAKEYLEMEKQMDGQEAFPKGPTIYLMPDLPDPEDGKNDK